MTSQQPPAAIETLLAEREWVRALARSLLDANRADDVEQETWLAATRSTPADTSTPRAWLGTVVRHFAIRARRSEGRRRVRELASARPEATPSTADMVARADAHRRVVNAVFALDEPYRSTVIARFFEDLPPREIARRMQVPVETVRTRTKRALAQLRERLDEEHGGDGRAWCVALAPLALAKGGLLVKTTTKATVAMAALLLFAGVAGLTWLANSATPTERARDDVSAVAAKAASVPSVPAGTSDTPPATATNRAGEVRGEVWFRSPEKPAPGVEVVLDADGPSPSKATTDETGRFVVAALPVGFRGLVRVRVPGYATVSRFVMPLRAGERRDLGFLWLSGGASARFIVRDADDRPVAGAFVEGRRTASGGASIDQILVAAEWRDARDADAVATTDATGTAAFDDLEGREWTFVARKPGFADAAARDVLLVAGKPAETITLHLFPGLPLEGRILDREGRGIAGVNVAAQATSGGWQHPDAETRTAVSDTAGRYAFDSLVAGDYRVRVGRTGGPSVIAGTVRLPSSLPVDVVLGGNRLVGTVRDVEGAPIEGALVGANVHGDGAVETTTDAEGRYVLDTIVPAATLGPFRVTKPGYVEAIGAGPNGRDARAVEAGVLLVEGKDSVRDFLMRRAAVLRGGVTCAGAPVVDALVEARRRTYGIAGTRTDRDGRYAFDCLPAETVFVFVAKDGMGRAASGGSNPYLEFREGRDGPDSVGVPATGEVVHDVELVRNVPGPAGPPKAEVVPIHVRGRVTGPAPELRSAWVQVSDVAQSSARGDAAAWMDVPRWPVGRDGRFDVTRASANAAILVRAGAEGCAAATVKATQAADAPGTFDAKLTLAAGTRIAGRVVLDESDAPCAGADVVLDAEASRGWSYPSGRPSPATIAARTDADGRFVIEGLASGPHSIDVDAVDRLLVRKEVAAPADGVVVRMRPALSISGVVKFADGTPLVRGSVGVASDDEPWRGRTVGVAITADDGSFVAGYLPPGVFRLRVTNGSSGAAIAATEVEGVAAGATGLRIEVGRGLDVKGRVTSADGRPVAGAQVMAARADGRVFSAATRADGSFEIGALVSAEYEVTADPPMAPLYEGVPMGAKWLRAKLSGVRPPRDDVLLVLPAGLAIEGRLVDAAGTPIAMRLVRADILRGQESDASRGAERLGALTDKSGGFRITGLAPARYRLVDNGQAGVRDAAPLVGAEDVAAGATNVRAVLGAYASISGVVVDESGAPVARSRVVLVSATGERQQASVRADGSFEAKGLDAGAAYDVHATAAGLAPSKLAGVAAGSTGVRLVLRPGLASSGRLADASGRPLAGVVVSFTTDASAITVTAKTDTDGRFTVDGLLAGTWRATYWGRRGGRSAQVACGAFEAGAVDVELRAAE